MRPEVYPLRQNVHNFIVDKVFPSVRGGEVLEIGPMQMQYTPVKECFVDTRRHFTEQGARYVSCDIDTESGCDVITDVLNLKEHFPAESFDCILALEVLEHTSRIWDVPDIFNYLLRPKGKLFVSVPYYFYRHHPFPDFWRISEDGLRLLFAPGFDLHIEPLIEEDERKPLQYTMIATKK